MSMPPHSRARAGIPPPGSRPEKLTRTTRRRRRQPRFQRLLTYALLVILVVGCVSLGSLSVFWVLIRSEGTIFGDTNEAQAGNLSAWLAQATPARFVRATLPADGPLPLQDAPNPFLLPEPTLTSEPTPIATQAVIYLPTSTKTPTPTLVPTQAATATGPPAVAAVPAQPEAPAQAGIQHVVMISIDGLRPDALELADTPALDNLRANGAYSPGAKAVMPSLTMPNHASMLSGMAPAKHGILWNLPSADTPRVNGPTLFNVAHDAGLSTMMVVGKLKLEYLVLPNSVDQFIGNDVTDMEVKNRAVEVIQAGLPAVLFIHFPDVDKAGHSTGWMSPGQLQTVTTTDGLISQVVVALEGGGYLNSTLLIVTADHGGHDMTHGSDSPEDTTIPWLAVGPGVPAGVILTSPITTYDTAATALYALKLPIPEGWDGQPVLEIFK